MQTFGYLKAASGDRLLRVWQDHWQPNFANGSNQDNNQGVTGHNRSLEHRICLSQSGQRRIA
jgi:hypothetical protein